MATLPPGRLHDVSNAADFVALTETNFEILTSEVFRHEPTYMAGVPTTTVGPLPLQAVLMRRTRQS
jgi:hypothetical protein